jgi:hypothetical protein
MVKTKKTIIAIILLVGIQSPQLASAQGFDAGVARCLETTELAIDLRDEYSELMIRRDEMAVMILKMSALSRVDSSRVQIERDRLKCEKAALAFAKATGRPVAPVHVIAVGQKYLVIDPTFYNGGEWKSLLTFNKTFSRLLARVGY